MSWTPRRSRSGIEYGGAKSSYYWTSVNPGANYSNCLANCTTLAYGRVLEEGCRAPVSSFRDAGNWHTVVANGWTAESYSSYVSSIKPGDIIEWPGHVAVVETVSSSTIYCSSSLYTGDHGRAYWPPGSGNYDTRSSAVMGSTLQDVSDWMIANYAWRFYEYTTVDTISNVRLGVQPTYILVNPDSGGGPTPPPTPSEELTIDINPGSYNVVMSETEDFKDFTFTITISGIPAGQTVSGGNSFPGLSRIYNSGWSYTDYTVGGVGYRTAVKTQTLRYDREHSYAYTITKHMYFNLSFSTGTVNTDTPMYITVKAKIAYKMAAIISRRRKRGIFHVFRI